MVRVETMSVAGSYRTPRNYYKFNDKLEAVRESRGSLSLHLNPFYTSLIPEPSEINI